MSAQESAITLVPRLIRFSGKAQIPGQTAPAGATFSVYNAQVGGTLLWVESQNITPDESGSYSALLGSTGRDGLPVDVFDTSEPRWLQVELNGVAVPRVLIAAASSGAPTSNAIPLPRGVKAAVTGGTAGYLGVFTSSTDLGNSVLYQSGNTVSIGGTSSLGAMTLIGSAPSGDTAGMALYNSGGGGGASVSLDMYNTYANGGIPQAKIKALDDGAFSDHITFWTKNPGAATNAVSERVRITSTGRVGIGTTTPGAALEIAGSLKLSGVGSNITFPDGTTLSAGTPGGVPPPSPTANLQAIGQMRWGFDQRSTLTRLNLKQPLGLYWDGFALWIANGGAPNLTRFNPATDTTATIPSTGALAGTPHSLCFDGENVWATIPAKNQVQAISLESETIVATVNVGPGPAGCTFDGENVWIANHGGNTVSKINARSMAVTGTSRTGENPFSVSFDGTYVWVANNGDGTVSKLQAASGETVATIRVGANPLEQVFDGADIWVANAGGFITKVNTESGATSNLSIAGSPRSIVFDGTYLWIVNSGSPHGSVTKVLASTGEQVGVSRSAIPLSPVFSTGPIFGSVTRTTTQCRYSGRP